MIILLRYLRFSNWRNRIWHFSLMITLFTFLIIGGSWEGSWDREQLAGKFFDRSGWAADSKPSQASPPPMNGASLAPFQFHAANRVVAIGDLHGDAAAMRRALRLARAIDEKDHWIGKDLVVVQTGDQVDRWHQDREVLDFMEQLNKQAKIRGGRVISLLGNHEIFNASRNFSFVTPKSFEEFLNFPVPASYHLPSYVQLSRPGVWGIRGVIVDRKDPGVINRAYAFEPGGIYSKLLSRRPLFAIVNDSIFVHGGITLQDIREGLAEKSLAMQHWMQGENKSTPEPEFPEMAQSRVLSMGVPSEEACHDLSQVLNTLKLKRMVVGHSIQDHGINSACSNQVWRIDVMLSQGYRENDPDAPPFEVLEIKGDRVSVITAKNKRKRKFEDLKVK